MLPGSLQARDDARADRAVPRPRHRAGRRCALQAGRSRGTCCGLERVRQAQVVLSDRVARETRREDRRQGEARCRAVLRSSAVVVAREARADDVTATDTFTVAAVLPADAPGNDFNLTPNPAAPLNVFVPIRTLSRAVRRPATPTPSANALLASGAASRRTERRAAREAPARGLTACKFREIRRGARLPQRRIGPDSSFRTRRSTAIEAAAKDVGLRAEPTVVYVADTLAHGQKEIPYPIVAGLNPERRAAARAVPPEGR